MQGKAVNNQTLSGAIGAAGLVIQIVLGRALSNSGSPTGSSLILPHMLIGVGGIALVAFLASSVFFTPSSRIVRPVYVLAFDDLRAARPRVQDIGRP